jgi:hypothetical protein
MISLPSAKPALFKGEKKSMSLNPPNIHLFLKAINGVPTVSRCLQRPLNFSIPIKANLMD